MTSGMTRGRLVAVVRYAFVGAGVIGLGTLAVLGCGAYRQFAEARSFIRWLEGRHEAGAVMTGCDGDHQIPLGWAARRVYVGYMRQNPDDPVTALLLYKFSCSLYESHRPAVVEVARYLLQSKHEATRTWAAYVLVTADPGGYLAAISIVKQVLKRRPEVLRGLRYEAALRLGEAGDPEALEILRPLAVGSTEGAAEGVVIRDTRAAEVLGRMGDESTLRAIRDIVSGPSSRRRWDDAAFIVVAIRDEEGVGYLIRHIEEGTPDDASAAAASLSSYVAGGPQVYLRDTAGAGERKAAARRARRWLREELWLPTEGAMSYGDWPDEPKGTF